MNEEESLEEQLNNLVAETRQHPQGTVERQRVLNKLLRIIQRLGKPWRDSSPDYKPALQLLVEELNELVAETCKYPQGSLERQKGLNNLVWIIQESGKLWKESSPYYEDALHQTWVYFCRNLCEAITAKSAYDPTKASITTWLNNYLRPRLLDLRIKRQEEINTFVLKDDIDITGVIPYPEPKPDLLTSLCEWIEEDADGKFKGRIMPSRHDINAQLVCLKHLRDGETWQKLSTELRINYQTLITFYKRHCIPLLKEFPEIDDFR